MRTFLEAMSRTHEMAVAATNVVRDAVGEPLAEVLLEFRGEALHFRAQTNRGAKPTKNPGVWLNVEALSGVLHREAMEDVLGSNLERLGRVDVGMLSYAEESFEILKELLNLDSAVSELTLQSGGFGSFGERGALFFEVFPYARTADFFASGSMTSPRKRISFTETEWNNREALGEQAWSHYQARVAPHVDNMSSNVDSDVPTYLQEYVELLVSGQVEHISFTRSAGGNSKRNPSVFQPIPTIE